MDGSIYAKFGLDKPPWNGDPKHRLAESGQILFDRVRHHGVLQWLWLLNSHTEVVYKAMHGDKVGRRRGRPAGKRGRGAWASGVGFEP